MVLTFLDYILSLAKAQDKIKSEGLNILDKEKISVQKLYNCTANQNYSVINSFNCNLISIIT